MIEIKNQLEQTGCPILGAVLNMVKYDDYMSRKYYYKSYYSHYGDYNSEYTKKGDGGKTKPSKK